MIDLPPQLDQCAPGVLPVLMHALVRAESAWNPYAIGPDDGQSAVAQPKSLKDAVKTAQELLAAGGKFSVGLAQIHASQITARGITWEQAFDACQNLNMGQVILFEYYDKARKEGYAGVDAVWAALRGYNSGSVNKEISDKYARKIFTYMREHPASGAPGKVIKTTPASTDARFFQFAETSPINMTDVNISSVQGAPKAGKVRQGESADIFQEDDRKNQGF